MRQLKGSKKLSRKEKQELRQENDKIQEQVKRIVLPTLGGIAVLIVIYVLYVSRSIWNYRQGIDKESGSNQGLAKMHFILE